MRSRVLGLALLILGCGSQKPADSAKGTGTGGSGGASGSSGASGTGGTNARGGSGGTVFVPPVCAPGSDSGRSDDAPALEPGVWTAITPEGIGFASAGGGDKATQGMTIDPCNPNTLYVCIVPTGGIYRSTDAGTSWTELGAFDTPINVRVDPRDPLHMYVCDGVTGSTNGFYVTKDGGQTWTIPDGFKAIADQLHDYDVYHVEPNPADFNHVLVSFHYYWNNSDNSGVVESFDGGDNWIIHQPDSRWNGAGGYNIFFLYEPTMGIGDANTWLFGTQGKGYWRTTNAGETWTQVTTSDMQHGGGTLYYSADGTLYLSGNPSLLRSTDNGASWTLIGPTGGFLSIQGDGNYLYAGAIYGPTAIIHAPESDPTNWTAYGDQLLDNGPFHMAFDKRNGIMYSSNTNAGVFALKVVP